MTKFVVTAKNTAGKLFNEVVDTVNSSAAVSKVQSQGLFVTSVKQVVDEPVVDVRPAASSDDRKFTHNKVGLEDIISFSRQLATMINSGVPLMRAISVIAEQVESRELSRVLDVIISDVSQGQSFSRSLSKHPLVFTPFWVSLVEVGEASGTMPAVLEKLTLYMEQSAAFRSAIIGALVYPIVLFVICMGAVLFFALFIGPTFEKVFKDMGMELPGITMFVMALFKFIKTKFLFLVGGFAGAWFLLVSYIKTDIGRRKFESLLFKMPVFGKVIKLIVVEKFTSQMAILIDSGVPILYALEISERLVDNLVCAEIIKRIREAVREGKLLADPMEQSGFFPSMAVQMIRVGEETGELGQMLNHVAVFYKRNVEEFMKRFGVMIEPIMLVFMGGIIGVIVVAMFLPILTLSSGGK